MTSTTAPRRPSIAARRFGYAVAMSINGALLYLVNVRPGWDALPFLTARTTEALGWVNASIAAGIIANALYVVADARWFRALGDAVVILIGWGALVRLWQVFPFAFDDDGLPWHDITRWLLALGMVGSGIGVIVNVITLVRAARNPQYD